MVCGPGEVRLCSQARKRCRQLTSRRSRQALRWHNVAVMTTARTHPHTRDELPPPSVEEVADGVYAYIQPDGTWFINNCGFVTGTDQTVVIDATSIGRSQT